MEKLENCKRDEGMLSQSEERLCRSIIKGLARRNHERHTMLADVEEEQEQDVICFDDITGKELPWHAVRKARELELKYLRDLGVYEKVDEKEAVEKYGVTPVDTKWVDTDKAFEREPMQIRSRMCAREFKSDDRPDLYAGTPPLEALKAIISVAANHKETFSIMHIDVSRAYFHAKAQRPVLIRLPAEDRMGTDAGKIGLMKKTMYGTRDAASNWERDWQERVKKWGFQLGLRDWLPVSEPAECNEVKMWESVDFSACAKNHVLFASDGSGGSRKTQPRNAKEHQDVEHLEVATFDMQESCTNMITDTFTCFSKDLGLSGNGQLCAETGDSRRFHEAEKLWGAESKFSITSTDHRLPDVCSSANIEQTSRLIANGYVTEDGNSHTAGDLVQVEEACQIPETREAVGTSV